MLQLFLIALWFAGDNQWFKQKQSNPEPFLQQVAPLITPAEAEIYASLSTESDRNYFETVFWYKRAPDPVALINQFKHEYFERLAGADLLFAEVGVPGRRTERGRIFLLLGEPDDVTFGQASSQELWHYGDLKIAYHHNGSLSGHYKRVADPKFEGKLDKIREDLIVDHVTPYLLRPRRLRPPDVGFTATAEALGAFNSNEVKLRLDLVCFPGEDNRSRVLVVLTPEKGAPIDVNIDVFDPFQRQVVRMAGQEQPRRRQPLFYYLDLKPDQYELLLRVRDAQGRLTARHQTLHVPDYSMESACFSDLVLSDGLHKIPPTGFNLPAQFRVDDYFLSARYHFDQAPEQGLHVMMLHNCPPQEIVYSIDGQIQKADEVVSDRWQNQYRTVVALPLTHVTRGRHVVSARLSRRDGSYRLASAEFNLEGEIDRKGPAIWERAANTDSIRLEAPQGDTILDLKKVALQTKLPADLMTVYLNNRAILARTQPPWEVAVDRDLYSLSGSYRLTAVLHSKGIEYKVGKLLAPLLTDEQTLTATTPLSFNLKGPEGYISHVDPQAISVSLEGQALKPRNIHLEEGPMTICFMLDTSRPMAHALAKNKAGIERYIRGKRAEDRCYFVTFSQVGRRFSQPTASKAMLLAMLKAITSESGWASFLFDGVIAGLADLQTNGGRKVLVLMSHGQAKEGFFRRTHLMAYARTLNIPIFTLWQDNNPGKSPLKRRGDDTMRWLAEETGGHFYTILGKEHITVDKAMTDIEAALANRLVMTVDMPGAGTWPIEVNSLNPNEKVTHKSPIMLGSF